jgi:hypothetical protein
VYRQYRVMANGKGATALGVVTDVERSVVQSTHHVHQICMSGPTAQRPHQGDADFSMGVQLGVWYLDTTLNAIIVADGAGNWRSPTTGALV